MGTFAGILEQNALGRRAYVYPIGFRSILEVYQDNLRFIKVTDFKGVPMQNVSVTVNNTGGATTTITNQDGVAEIVPDVATSITIDIKQYSTERNGITYNTTTDPVTKILVLDTVVPHL